ncbi:MAG: CPBP family intramembrane glutamic endopeptidase [Verrucomicrobiota bacterium]
MAFDGFLPALSAVTNALFLLAGVYIYVSLVRQVRARSVEFPEASTNTFGLGDAILAIAVAAWFILNIATAASQEVIHLRSRDLAANALFSVGMVFFIAIFLRFRGRDVNMLGGFSAVSFRRAIMTGMVLMLAAYPLVFLGDVVTQRYFHGPPEKQAIVDLFTTSDSLGARMIIIVLAVALAPIAEEFLFRFFFYGVLKRYFGRFVGLIVNALLFAAVHAHLPSFAPLFILGTCFTIAYEWSGSILVSMTMHALFNALTLTALAFPELIQ